MPTPITDLLSEITEIEGQMSTESCGPAREPFIKYPSSIGANPPVVDFNIPQTTALTTYGYIAVPIDVAKFKTFTLNTPTNNFYDLVAGMSQDQAFQLLYPYVAAPSSVLGTFTPTLVTDHPSVRTSPLADQLSAARSAPNPGNVSSAGLTNAGGDKLIPFDVGPQGQSAYTVVAAGPPQRSPIAELAVKGIRPVFLDRLSNRARTTQYVAKPPAPAPRIFIIEEYTTTSYLGNYGAGKVVKTFTLLPGERTTISIRSYKDMVSTQESAKNVLDSMSNSSATELDTLMQKEQGFMDATSDTSEGSGSSFSTQSDSKNSQKSYGISGNLGIGAIGVGGGFGKSKGDTQTSGGGMAATYGYNHSGARASNVSTLNNSLTKHVQQSNANRLININTTTSSESRSGEEESIVRVLENCNKSRVLNFVFRQLLQEYDVVTSLTNLKFAYTNGYPESFTVVDLPNLNNMLRDIIIDGSGPDIETERNAIKCKLLSPYCHVLDYNDADQAFVQSKTVTYGGWITGLDPLACVGVATTEQFWRVVKGLTTEVTIGGNIVDVPGIVLSVEKQTLQTSSTIADAMLGAGEALDCYNKKVQDADNMAAYINNMAAMQRINDNIQNTELNKDIVDQQVTILTDVGTGAANAADQVAGYKKVFGKCCPTPQNTGGCGCGNCD